MLRLQRALLHDYRGMNMTKTDTARKAVTAAVNRAIANGSPVITEKRVAPTAITVAMSYSKETPGTFVFAADEPDAPITTIYIRKAAMKVAPKTIRLTVEG